MKSWLCALPVLIILCTGCAEKPPEPAAPRTPEVYTVNYPLAWMAGRIGGGYVNVTFPSMEGDPAFWRPAPEEVTGFQQADLVLLNGASYAKWIPKVSLPGSRLVDTSAAFKGRFIPLEGEMNHTHGPGGEHAHGDVAFTVWLDPTLAILQAAAVRDALTAQWPERKQLFADGYHAVQAALQQLDQDVETAFAAWGQQPLVGSHPVFQYLSRRYGLNLQSVHWEPDVEPDEKMWRELEELLSRHPAKTMLWEDAPLESTRDQLAARGIRSVVFNPCGNRPAEGDYLTMMQANLEAVAAAGGAEP